MLLVGILHRYRRWEVFLDDIGSTPIDWDEINDELRDLFNTPLRERLRAIEAIVADIPAEDFGASHEL